MPALSFLFPPDDPSMGSTSSALPSYPRPGGLDETSGDHQMVARRLWGGGSGHGPSGCCSAHLQHLLMKPWRMRYHVFTFPLPYPFGLLLILLNLSMLFFYLLGRYMSFGHREPTGSSCLHGSPGRLFAGSSLTNDSLC